MTVSSPAPPIIVAFGSAPFASSSVSMSRPPTPSSEIERVLATVGVPPRILHRAAVDEDRAGGVP